MADNDIQFKDLSASTKSPRLRERPNNVAEPVHGVSNEAGVQINPSRDETLVILGNKIDALVTAVGNLLTDSQLRASTLPVSVSNVMTETTGLAIKNAISGLNDFQETVFTSPDGNTVYFRRALYSEVTDAITITWTDVAGTTISTPSSAVPLKSNTNVDTDIHYFDVVANGTGYSIGSIVARIVIVNLATGLPTSTLYYNLNTSAVVTPLLGDIVLQDQNVKAVISNFPVTQAVTVGNFPATQAVSVGNFPSTQAVSVGNFPATQAVSIAAEVEVKNDSGNPLSNSELPIQGIVELTAAGTSYTSGRAIKVSTTTAGTLTLTFIDGTSYTRNFPVGLTILPYAIVKWDKPTSPASTFAGNVYNLK
jgi:hypothetical protein